MTLLDFFLAFGAVVTLGGAGLGWQLLHQNGRLLLRIEELERRLDENEIAEAHAEPNAGNALLGNDLSNRFRERSLARSKIRRDGLKAGEPAPDFRLPRLDGRGELSLDELRGDRVLLIFSDPHCGPCNALAPELEKFHRDRRGDIAVVMISRGDPADNRAKVKEYGLTFPILLQQQWEISRRYALFATPIAYIIDDAGMIAHDVARGADAIVDVMANLALTHRRIQGELSEQTGNT